VTAPERPRRARVGVNVAFAVHAAVAGSYGPRLPLVKQQAGLDQTGLGLVLAGLATGLFVGTRIAAWPVARFGSRAVITVCIPALGLSLVGVGLARNAASVAGTFVVVGIVAGLLDVTNNAQAVAVERSYGRSLMHGIHGTWSAALLASGAVSAAATRFDVSLPVHFAAVAVLVTAVGMAASPGLLPGAVGVREDDTPTGERGSGPAIVLLIGLIGFSSFLAEGVAADWSAVYFHEGRGTGTALAAIGFVAFSVGMTASRFVGDAIVGRLGAVPMTRAAGIAATAGFVLAVMLPVPGAIVAFAVIGVALGPVVPVAFSAAGNTRVGRTGTALGWVVTLSYAGSIVGPALVGVIAGATGIRTALLVPMVFALAIVGAAGTVRSAHGTPIGPTVDRMPV
jgi:MFS family permease